MQMNARPALLQRIGRLLRAKEFLVFYAIGLGLLDLGAPLATGWLFRHRSLATLLRTDNTVAGDAAAGRGAAVIAVAAAYLLVSAFFTAGYLRSLLGRLHWGPRDARQFVRLVALLTPHRHGLVGPRRTGGHDERPFGDHELAAALCRRDDRQCAAGLRRLRDRGEQRRCRARGRALRADVRRQRVRLAVRPRRGHRAILVLGQLLPGDSGRALALGPAVLIHVLVWGSVSFLSDVVLLSVYIDSIERGTIPPN